MNSTFIPDGKNCRKTRLRTTPTTVKQQNPGRGRFLIFAFGFPLDHIFDHQLIFQKSETGSEF